jgi:hypothetical protein
MRRKMLLVALLLLFSVQYLWTSSLLGRSSLEVLEEEELCGALLKVWRALLELYSRSDELD